MDADTTQPQDPEVAAEIQVLRTFRDFAAATRSATHVSPEVASAAAKLEREFTERLSATAAA